MIYVNKYNPNNIVIIMEVEKMLWLITSVAEKRMVGGNSPSEMKHLRFIETLIRVWILEEDNVLEKAMNDPNLADPAYYQLLIDYFRYNNLFTDYFYWEGEVYKKGIKSPTVLLEENFFIFLIYLVVETNVNLDKGVKN